MPSLRTLASTSAALLVAGILVACGPQPDTGPGTPLPTPTQEPDGVQPAGVPVDVTTGLAAPWSILRILLSDGSDIVLVSERDTGDVQQVMPDGSRSEETRLNSSHQSVSRMPSSA